MSPGPFLEPTLSAKKQRCFYQPGPFTSLPLYPFMDVPAPKGFCDLTTVLSSTCYFLCPVGDFVPFERAVVGPVRQECWSLLPACKATPVLLAAHSLPRQKNFEDFRPLLRLLFPRPHHPGRCPAEGNEDRQVVSAGAQGCCNRQAVQSEPARHRGQPCPKHDVPCTLCAPACRVLARDLAPLNRGKEGAGTSAALKENPYNTLCNPCTSPVKGNGELLNEHGETEQSKPQISQSCLCGASNKFNMGYPGLLGTSKSFCFHLSVLCKQQ